MWDEFEIDISFSKIEPKPKQNDFPCESQGGFGQASIHEFEAVAKSSVNRSLNV